MYTGRYVLRRESERSCRRHPTGSSLRDRHVYLTWSHLSRCGSDHLHLGLMLRLLRLRDRRRRHESVLRRELTVRRDAIVLMLMLIGDQDRSFGILLMLLADHRTSDGGSDNGRTESKRSFRSDDLRRSRTVVDPSSQLPILIKDQLPGCSDIDHRIFGLEDDTVVMMRRRQSRRGEVRRGRGGTTGPIGGSDRMDGRSRRLRRDRSRALTFEHDGSRRWRCSHHIVGSSTERTGSGSGGSWRSEDGIGRRVSSDRRFPVLHRRRRRRRRRVTTTSLLVLTCDLFLHDPQLFPLQLASTERIVPRVSESTFRTRKTMSVREHAHEVFERGRLGFRCWNSMVDAG